MAKKDPSTTLQYMSEVNGQLSDEVRRLRQGDYTRLFKQSRSFIDALQRSPKGQLTTYGPSITSIAKVRDCYEDSKRLDKDRKTHFTEVIGYFISLVDAMKILAQRVREWIGDTVNELTVHERQKDTAKKIQSEIGFMEKFLEEHNELPHNRICTAACVHVGRYTHLNRGPITKGTIGPQLYFLGL